MFTPVLHQDLILITAPEHPLSVKEEVCIEELISYPIIGYNSKASETQNVISNLFSTSILKPNIICEVEEEMSIAGLVSINYGIAIVPDLDFSPTFPSNAFVLSTTGPIGKYIWQSGGTGYLCRALIHFTSSFCTIPITQMQLSNHGNPLQRK